MAAGGAAAAAVMVMLPTCVCTKFRSLTCDLLHSMRPAVRGHRWFEAAAAADGCSPGQAQERPGAGSVGRREVDDANGAGLQGRMPVQVDLLGSRRARAQLAGHVRYLPDRRSACG